MAALTAEQRAAILHRYGGLVRTYFSTEELREARFAYQAQLGTAEVEFYLYLRLAAVLQAGRELIPILTDIARAPSFSQEQASVNSRGLLNGRLNARAYLRRLGQQTQPRTFPVWRVFSSFATPENMLAGAAGNSLLRELQQLGARLPIGERSEELLINALIAELEPLLREPVLGGAAQEGLPDLIDEEADAVLNQVAERWTTRRISNLAYRSLWRWADAYRRRGLAPSASTDLAGTAYIERFDDRLFEIFVLGSIRDSLVNIGFQERQIRPLHARSSGPVLEVVDPNTGLAIDVHFQQGAQLLWTATNPSEWEDIRGIPDIVLRPRQQQYPLMIVDAKNRDRGADPEGITEELYKMLGYFNNFASRLRVRERGPVGGLAFRSSNGSGTVQVHRSRRPGGGLFVIALDPCDLLPPGEGAARALVENMLRQAGLLADREPINEEVRRLKGQAWATTSDDNNEDLEQQVLQRMHDVLTASYKDRGADLEEARNSLDQHLLGSCWVRVPDDVRTVLATAEVFWSDHQLAVGMDFAPVVAELARALEITLEEMLFKPSRRWAQRKGLDPVKDRLELGTMRVVIEEAAKIGAGQAPGKTPGIIGLHKFLESQGLTTYCYSDLVADLAYANGPRRRAAHKEVLSGLDARQFRERLLGIGSASSLLAHLVEQLPS